MRDEQIEAAQRETDAQCEGQPVKALSRSGFHASRELIDALKYTPGNRVCRVQVSSDQRMEIVRTTG